MSTIHINSSKYIVFEYTNYKGEKATRTAMPQKLEWGTTPYHKEPQWLLRCICPDKDYAERSFAMKDMLNVRYEP